MFNKRAPKCLWLLYWFLITYFRSVYVADCLSTNVAFKLTAAVQEFPTKRSWAQMPRTWDTGIDAAFHGSKSAYFKVKTTAWFYVHYIHEGIVHILEIFLCLHIVLKRCHFFLNFGVLFDTFELSTSKMFPCSQIVSRVLICYWYASAMFRGPQGVGCQRWYFTKGVFIRLLNYFRTWFLITT